MIRVLLILLLITSFPLPVMPQKPAPPLQADWKEFVSQEGNFAVLLPGKPSDERTEKELRYRLNIGPRVFGVARLQEFERGETVDRTLNNLADEFVKGAEGRVINKKQIALDGHPGLSVKFESAEPPGVTEVYYYLVNRQMYVLIAFTRSGNTEENAERFLKSFRFLKK